MDIEEIRQQLPDLADGLHTRLIALADAPTESAADAMARDLFAARVMVARLASLMHRGVSHG